MATTPAWILCRIALIVVATGAILAPAPTLAQPKPAIVKSADTTEVVASGFVTVTSSISGNHLVGPFDVSRFRSVRVMLVRGSCSPCGDPVNAGILSNDPQFSVLDSFQLTTPAPGGVSLVATRVYDVPGLALTITLWNPSGAFSNTVGYVIYGRPN